MNELELIAPISNKQLAINNQPSPPTELNLQAISDRILSGELTNEKLGMIKELVAMDAERKFVRAFVELQAEMPKVKAVRAVPNNDGTVRYNFAPYEEIMAQVAPLLQKHGFTISFSTDFQDGRMVKYCELQHQGGHKKTNRFAARVGSGPPKASEAQADGAAGTYAKRGALCDALNIVIDHDTDARAEGDYITAEQSDELARRVALTNTDRVRFLAFAGAETFDTIPAAKYEILDQQLQRKENPKTI